MSTQAFDPIAKFCAVKFERKHRHGYNAHPPGSNVEEDRLEAASVAAPTPACTACTSLLQLLQHLTSNFFAMALLLSDYLPFSMPLLPICYCLTNQTSLSLPLCYDPTMKPFAMSGLTSS